MNDFLEWVNQEKERLGLSLSDMAKAIKYSRTHINDILHKKSPMTVDFCIGLAQLLNRPEIEIIAISGILPNTNNNKEIESVIRTFTNLNNEKRNQAINFLKFLEAETK